MSTTMITTVGPSSIDQSFSRSSSTFSSSISSSSSSYHSPIAGNMIAGAVALSTAFTIMHPLDTIKTLMQSGTKHSISSHGLSHYLRPLLRGVLVSAAGAAPQGGIRLSTYEYTKEAIRHNIGFNAATSPASIVIATSAAGAICGDLASCLVKLPREVLVNRMQTGVHKDFTSACVAIAKEEGITGFYRGFLSTSCRDIPFMVLLFACYENMRIISQKVMQKTHEAEESLEHLAEEMHLPHNMHHLPHIPALHPTTQSAAHPSQPTNIKKDKENSNVCQPGSLCSSAFGGISGSIAGFCTTPFDVIKTRILMMSRLKDHHNGEMRVQQVRMRDAIDKIVEESNHRYYSNKDNHQHKSIRMHQLQSFFVGAVPRSTWWFAVCAMFFPIYETVKGTVNQY